jgi:hypothetical protein
MNPVLYVLSKYFWPAFGGSIFGLAVFAYAPHLAEMYPQRQDAIYIVAILLTFIFSALPVLSFLFVVYFLPAIAAKGYRHRNERAIFALNLLLGWTFVGWALALVWALTDDPAPALPTPEPAPAEAQIGAPSDKEELIGWKVLRAFKEGLLGGRQ